MSGEALEQARRLMTQALSSASTLQERRIFHTHLIALCSYPSYDCKSFFGTLIAKFFTEFEDLQDKAVDALLDLCEDDDEKTRIIGIKGLGATGKADPRWVRGNTGVLLQLLECPPRELRHVRESLYTLLTVSPTDAFAVMADDCKGSEEETGASRRNILGYLEGPAASARRDILESGHNLDAEKVFREGFTEVLGTTAISETRLVVGLLIPLSTISGKHATIASTSAFVRTLTNSLHPGSSTALTQPLVRLFADLVRRKPPLDPRYATLFLSAHGGAVVALAIEKEDAVAVGLVEKLRLWTTGAIASWSAKSSEEDQDVSLSRLAPTFCKTVLDALLHRKASTARETSIAVLETALFSVYSIMTVSDSRRELIDGPASRSLLELSRDAARAEKRATRDSTEARARGNVQEIAEILADHHQALRTVVPSWENRPQRSHATKEVSLKGRAPAASASSSTNAGSQSQQTQAVSRSAPEAAGESSETVKPSPDTRRTPSNAPGAATATSTEKPSTAGMRGGASSRPSAEDFLARSPFHGAGPSTGRTPSIQDTVLQQSRPGRELLGNRAISSGSTAKRELLSDSKPTEPSPSSHSSQELMLNAPPVKVSTIRDPPPHLAHRESSIPAQQPQITKQSNGARELLPSSTASSSARGLIPAPSSPAPSPSPSLAERLGMAPPSQTKRPRDDPPLSDDSRPSLLSRLSSTDAHPDSKRSRGDPTEPQKEAPSLLSRMGRVNGSNGLSTPRAAPPASLDSAPSLSIRNRTIPLIAPQGASILNQSISSKPRPIISQNEAPPTPATPLLIRNHSQPPLSTSLSIRNHSTAFPATPTPDEEVVVRKGRGFREVSPEDVVMSVPIPVPDPVQVPVRGALRRPGPMMSGSFGRGR